MQAFSDFYDKIFGAFFQRGLFSPGEDSLLKKNFSNVVSLSASFFRNIYEQR